MEEKKKENVSYDWCTWTRIERFIINEKMVDELGKMDRLNYDWKYNDLCREMAFRTDNGDIRYKRLDRLNN